MPQSHVQLYSHLIFSTKNREALLDDAIRPKVHAYLAVLLRDLDSTFVVVGGVADHVHILFDASKFHTPVEIVEKIKKDSLKFVKTLGSEYQNFYWQRGYGLFSVGPTQRNAMETYIRNQEEHHKVKSFKDEYRDFLTRYKLPVDEHYLWD